MEFTSPAYPRDSALPELQVDDTTTAAWSPNTAYQRRPFAPHSEPHGYPVSTPSSAASNGVPPGLRRAQFTDDKGLPPARNSLAAISLTANGLGIILGAALHATVYLILTHNAIWRLPFFISLLSLFHFLEFYITAAYNARLATTSAFLLTSNGWTYHLAHTVAMAECLLAHTTPLSLPNLIARCLPRLGHLLPRHTHIIVLMLGLAMVAVGQTTRTLAMAQAGTNFNHTVQTRRSQDHQLVTHGVFARLRHPSYFGFFWWGLGTQAVLGNPVCFLLYALALWSFFKPRIEREEEFLVRFFGKEYVEYRARTPVGIPFIR
ncbi:MAG: hypothetical protein M1819_006874 [Sarea resinae]|nr:MAG: hypothetical protein M1819_006874 [Sarea resinae]